MTLDLINIYFFVEILLISRTKYTCFINPTIEEVPKDHITLRERDWESHGEFSLYIYIYIFLLLFIYFIFV